MAKARLHWFWRGMIAMAVGTMADWAWWVLRDGALNGPACHLQFWLQARLDGHWQKLALVVISVGPGLLAAVGAFGLMTRWLGSSSADGELHCRRCHHILRGLSEPRCPECGEAI